MAAMKASFFTKSTGFLGQKIQEFFRFSSQWFLHTPERSAFRSLQCSPDN